MRCRILPFAQPQRSSLPLTLVDRLTELHERSWALAAYSELLYRDTRALIQRSEEVLARARRLQMRVVPRSPH
jgi:hypothetical protein